MLGRMGAALLVSAALMAIPASHNGGGAPPSSGPTVAVPAGVPMPDPRLTPGVALSGVTAVQVCRPGYASSVRAVSTATKNAVYREYGITRHAPDQYEVDHLISLELGGSNALGNLWPEPYAGPYGARAKDRLEDALHRRVCAGEMTLARAQYDISHNWYAAYRAYIARAAAG